MSDVTRLARNLISLCQKGTKRYQSVLAIPGARPFFLAAALARLGVAMTGLGILWTVRGLTGSFAIAGAATGLFALSEALAGPQLARLIDRYGQFRLIPVLLLVHGAGMGVVVWASATSGAAPVLLGATLAGAAVPQPGALSAARWTHLAPMQDQLRTAFSLEAVANDVVFLAGPPIVTIVSGLNRPYLGSHAAALCLITGGLALALQRRTEPRHQGAKREIHKQRMPLLTREFAAVFGVNLGLGFFFGAAPVVVTAFATGHGYGPAAGFILGLTSVASLLSGIAYGAMKERWRPHSVQLAASLLLVAAIGLGAISPTLPVLCLALVLAGATISPVMVTSSQIVAAGSGRSSLTQAFTWINTASASGIAGAAAVAGMAVELGNVQTALVVCCGLILVAPASALVLGRNPIILQ